MSKNSVRSRWSKIFLGYKISSTLVAAVAIGYLFLITFPQVLLGNTVRHGSFVVYSREAPDEAALAYVLDAAEQRLRTSPLYDAELPRRIYLTGSFGMYALFSNKAYGSFANSLPLIDNILVNKADLATDKVYIPRSYHDSRSLSGVIAHETAHLFIRRRYGTLAATLMPRWKNEGYCEYIAGDSTIPLDEGIRLWREHPTDDTAYRYTKYHAMVKFLLEKEGMSVDDLFTKDLDEKDVAARTLASYD